MSTDYKDIEFEIISSLIKKTENIFLFFDDTINVDELKEEIRLKCSNMIMFEEEFNKAISSLMEQEILTEERRYYLGLPRIRLSSYVIQPTYYTQIPNLLHLNKEALKDKILGNRDYLGIKEIYIEKENEAKEEIKEHLEELRDMIKKKSSEKELHSFIKDNNLISSPFIRHEFGVLVQNRNDFLIENEYGEFEIWELKSPSVKLFDVDKESIGKPERYNKLKGLSKSKPLVKAIEQLSIYKKEFIDHNQQHPSDNTELKENIYNAKLMLVIGSDEEFQGDNEKVYLEKLNLERYMLNNLGIITWEMFYKKIESYFQQMFK